MKFRKEIPFHLLFLKHRVRNVLLLDLLSPRLLSLPAIHLVTSKEIQKALAPHLPGPRYQDSVRIHRADS